LSTFTSLDFPFSFGTVLTYLLCLGSHPLFPDFNFLFSFFSCLQFSFPYCSCPRHLFHLYLLSCIILFLSSAVSSNFILIHLFFCWGFFLFFLLSFTFVSIFLLPRFFIPRSLVLSFFIPLSLVHCFLIQFSLFGSLIPLSLAHHAFSCSCSYSIFLSLFLLSTAFLSSFPFSTSYSSFSCPLLSYPAFPSRLLIPLSLVHCFLIQLSLLDFLFLFLLFTAFLSSCSFSAFLSPFCCLSHSYPTFSPRLFYSFFPLLTTLFYFRSFLPFSSFSCPQLSYSAFSCPCPLFSYHFIFLTPHFCRYQLLIHPPLFLLPFLTLFLLFFNYFPLLLLLPLCPLLSCSLTSGKLHILSEQFSPPLIISPFLQHSSTIGPPAVF
jgi:hypothetical protein